VNETFNKPTYERLGTIFSAWLKARLPQVERPWVAVGWDARVHSPELADTLIQSLTAAGVSVIRVGLVPSPLVYYTERVAESFGLPAPQASLVVTASHNPGPYNGLKMTLHGMSISREQLLEIKALFDAFSDEEAESAASSGEILNWDPIQPYLDWCRQQFNGFASRPKIVVDCGNGTAGVVAPHVMRALGCDVVTLFETPDGTFPNHHPDPCVHQNLQDLIVKVRETGAAFGVAFDGDTDRLGVVDDQGNIIPGDQLLMLYARDLMASWPTQQSAPAIVSEVKCSQHLFDEIARLGATPIMSPTGHAFIKQRMVAENAILGGELSGHLFFRDSHWGFDDAIYAALRLLAALESFRQKKPGAALSALTESLPYSCLSEERRVYLERDLRPQVLTDLHQQALAYASFAGLPVQSVDTLDGIRVNLSGGFWLVRLSNTEPCLTLRFEAPTPEALAQLESEVLACLSERILAVCPHWQPGQGGHH
jgi:phosphomannomutase